MGTVFISYRRDDAEGQAGRLYRDLVAVFGPDAVFMDVAAIEPGRDFRKVIHQSLDSCGVFLALIGSGWVNPRLDDAADFVRIETAAALKRDIAVIPVLVHGAHAPKPEQLPDDLKDLAYRNAIELTHARWDSDLQLLIKALRPYVLETSKKEAQVVQPVKKADKKWALIAIAAIAVVGLLFAFWSRERAPNPTVTDPVESQLPPVNAPAGHAKVASPQVVKPGNQKIAPMPSKTQSMNSNAPMVLNQGQTAAVKASPNVESIALAAKKQPLANNPSRATYTLWLEAPSEVSDDIARVHYDLVYDPNPLSLDGESAPPFRAVYEGWGCYGIVVVTVNFKSSASQPYKKTYNMCSVTSTINPKAAEKY